MNIINDPSITVDECREWLKTKNKCNEIVFDLLDTMWFASIRNGIDPCVLLAQSLIETDYFTNKINLFNRNTGNLRDVSLFKKYGGYTTFDSWIKGIHAHADHLALCAGANGFPKRSIRSKKLYRNGLTMFKLNELTFDPMHFEYLMGTCTKVEHLYNEERKNHDYAQKIVELVNEMIEFTKRTKEIEMNNKVDILTTNFKKLKEEHNDLYKELNMMKDAVSDLLEINLEFCKIIKLLEK